MAASSDVASNVVEDPPPLNHAPRQQDRSWWSGWLPSWKPTSEVQLEEAEKKILSTLSSEYRDLYVPIAEDAVVRSLVMEPQQPSVPDKPPLVLVHGFGCGILQFYKNLDHLHADRRLFALDLPGFARSTRIPFPEEAQAVEAVFVSALERWREGVGLEQFVLLGHSLGGFLCLSYAMTYPHRVRHLILDDPWGFPERSTEPPPPSSPHPSTSSSPPRTRRMPAWARVGAVFMSKFNPLTPVRMAGPLGPYVMTRFRRDLARQFGDDFMNYIYHCAAQNPTGETAFHYMQIPIGWAKFPMINRIGTELPASVPVTLIYGARSWMDSRTGERVKELRPHSYVRVHYVRRAGHHVHADQPDAFNSVVREVCCLVDRNEDIEPSSPHSVPDSGNGIEPEQPQPPQ